MTIGSFDGLGMHLGNRARLSNTAPRSIGAENFTGAKGEGGMATEGTGAAPARELGQGWKVSTSIDIPGAMTVEPAAIDRPGSILHIWLTVHPTKWRSALEGKRRYLPLQDDISSTVFWRQAEPHWPFPTLPGVNDFEVIQPSARCRRDGWTRICEGAIR